MTLPFQSPEIALVVKACPEPVEPRGFGNATM
jgi:hypothetical protein